MMYGEMNTFYSHTVTVKYVLIHLPPSQEDCLVSGEIGIIWWVNLDPQYPTTHQNEYIYIWPKSTGNYCCVINKPAFVCCR